MVGANIFVRDLSEGDGIGYIKGRITRMWSTVVGAVEFMLNDKMGDKVYCRVPGTLTKKHWSILEEGNFMKIKNFTVKKDDSSYRLWHNPYKIVFHNTIVATTIAALKIPRYCFVLRSVAEIEAGYIDSKILIDFFGRLIMSSVTIFPDNSTRITFLLEDMEGDYIRVYLWDELARRILNLCKDNAGPYDIVLAGCKVHVCGEFISIQGVAEKTSMYVNIDVKEGMHDAETEIVSVDTSSEGDTPGTQVREATSFPVESVLEVQPNQGTPAINKKRKRTVATRFNDKTKDTEIIDLTLDDE